MTNWNDPEVNPLGLKPVSNADPHGSPEIKVILPAKALAVFEDANGNVYACASVPMTSLAAFPRGSFP
jgi:hypothetical protein